MVPAISRADNMMMDNTKSDSKAEVAISGYCPVCALHGIQTKGSDNFVTEYNGKIYKFMDFSTQKAFIESPEEYTKDLEAKFQALMKK